MDDDMLVRLFTQIAHEPYLSKQIRFFLSTLEATEDQL
jgi:hypothetical protein